MKILILGAAGQIARLVTEKVLAETGHSLVLYARNAASRIKVTDPERVTVIEGDFHDEDKLMEALNGVDFVYLNDMNSPETTAAVVRTMEAAGVQILVAATILGIYDEVAGAFGKWNERMVGRAGIRRHQQSAAVIEGSQLDYTLLRLTWLYDQEGNENYETSQKGEPFIGTEVTRQAVARLVLDIIARPEKYARQSLGVVEPNKNFAKPSWY